MTNEHEHQAGLREAVVRICPACGVVNPAGPSETCPHLQLVRFKGIDDRLSEMLARLAVVRNEFRTLLAELRATVMHAARVGEADVEITQRGRVSDIDGLRRKVTPLVLSNPEPPGAPSQPAQKKKPKKTGQPKQVDPRQLALLAREPPQGDA